MPERTTRIELTPDELRQEREAAAAKGARMVIDELRDELDEIRADLKRVAITRDLVPEHVLTDWLSVSESTLKRWEVPVDSTQGNTRFYHMPTVIDYFRDEETDAKFHFRVTE
ncbi:hypothetical protein [Salinibacter ruber]|uniref:hypothetical protein n=1 Tax=Salinibacter ruber TaxID=146919 RepID=UPI0013C3375D|nr:hypothetical protein [Salinibacter ruber]